MDPFEARDIRRLRRIQEEFKEELTKGKVSKNFLPTQINLVEEYLDNKNIDEDYLREEEQQMEYKGKGESLAEEEEHKFIQNFELLPKKRVEPEPKIIDVDSLKRKLKLLLSPKETVSQAANRLRGPIDKPKVFKRNIRKSQKTSDNIEQSSNTENKSYELFCSIVSDLIASGLDEIYDLTIDEL